MKKKLLVIGGGYGGLKLIDNIHKDFDIVLIDQNKEHMEQTEIHRYLSEKITLDELIFSYESFARKKSIHFINAFVEKIDFDINTVFLKEERLVYDYLVIAIGSHTFFPKQIKGLEEYKKDIKSLEIVKKFKDDFDTLLSKRENNKNIIIAGAGLSGVEIAIELAQKIQDLGLENNIKVTIVEQQDTILPGSDTFLINKTKSVLDELGVICIHGEFITEVTDQHIILGNKKELVYDLSLFVLGVGPISIASEQSVNLNVKQQYVVNDYFQLEPYKNVFCIGDAAETKNSEGNYNLPTGQMANMQADVLSQNLINLDSKETLIKKDLKLKGVLVDLGKNNAVGILLNKIKISGYPAYLLKRFTSYIHKLKM